MTGSSPEPGTFAEALEALEAYLLDGAPSLTRTEVAEQAGVPLVVAQELWRLLGFAHLDDDEVAFTEADVEALRLSHDLMRLGILEADSQAALVRTWARSFARLAEWQTTFLAEVAARSGADPATQMVELAGDVMPRIDRLQSYIWRRHLVSAGSRLLTDESAASGSTRQAVVFCDIVGYTSRSKSLSQGELVEWIESFESECAGLATDHGGRIIKNIGDEVLLVADDPMDAAEIALTMTARGAADDDDFPAVRAGLAYGDVVARLGDVFGPTVNIAARLTSVARPGTVVVDQGAYEALSGREHREEEHDLPAHPEHDPDADAYQFRRIRRVSAKGYDRLAAWALRRTQR